MIDALNGAGKRVNGSKVLLRISTLDRYAGALGYRVQFHLIPEGNMDDDPPVVVHADE